MGDGPARETLLVPACQLNDEHSDGFLFQVGLSHDGKTAAVASTYVASASKQFKPEDCALFLVDLSDPNRKVTKVPIPDASAADVPGKIGRATIPAEANPSCSRRADPSVLRALRTEPGPHLVAGRICPALLPAVPGAVRRGGGRRRASSLAAAAADLAVPQSAWAVSPPHGSLRPSLDSPRPRRSARFGRAVRIRRGGVSVAAGSARLAPRRPAPAGSPIVYPAVLAATLALTPLLGRLGGAGAAYALAALAAAGAGVLLALTLADLVLASPS